MIPRTVPTSPVPRTRTTSPASTPASIPASTPTPALALVLLLLVSVLPACDGGPEGPGLAVAIPETPQRDDVAASDRLLEVVELQLAREESGLVEALEDASPEVRARAAFALASVQAPGAREALERRLDDPDPAVRRDVVFALGQLPPGGSDLLLLDLLATEDDLDVRERVLGALGKIGGAEAARALVEMGPLEGRLEEARALALSRRALALSAASEVDRELVGEVVGALAGGLRADDPEVRLRAAHFFARTPQVAAWGPHLETVREVVDSADPGEASVAPLLQGLVRHNQLDDHHRFMRALRSATDWRVRVAAAQALGTPRMIEMEGTRALLWDALREDPMDHVAEAAASALSGGVFAPAEVLSQAVSELERSTSEWRRQVPLVQVLGEMGREDEVLDWFDRLVESEGPIATVRAIEALRQVPSTRMGGPILALREHPDPQVRAAVVTAAAENWSGWVSSQEGLQDVYALLADAVLSGPGIAANRAARALAEPVFHSFGAVGVLLEADAARMEEDVFGRAVLLRAMGEAGDPVVEERLLDALDDDDFRIRRAAATGLEALTGLRPGGLGIPGVERPVHRERLAELGPRPRMVMETNRGEIVVVLAADQAPQTVSTVMAYAEEGAYDGIPFHRVIPNFVAQGGDVVFGDGTGSPDARLTSEFTQIPFVRGVVGMASSGKDTEGSQFFFAHSPQFHLDGGYTAFGWVESGADVMDRLQPLDRIESVRVEADGDDA